MLKQRVILIFAAIVFVAILYSLPTVVVNNDKDADIGKEAEGSVSAPEVNSETGDVISRHSFEVSLKDKIRIDKLRKKFTDIKANSQIAYADSIASLYISYDKYDSAAKYLEYIAVNDPSPDHFKQTGDAYYEAFSFAMDREKATVLGEKARYFYNLILDDQPERLDIKNKVAMTYVSSANPMQGIMMLRNILDEDPENEMALFNLGTLSIQSGQYDRAKEYFEKLIKLNPQNLQGQFYLGLSYFELGDKDKARKQFELVKSMEDDPAVIATAEGYLKELN